MRRKTFLAQAADIVRGQASQIQIISGFTNIGYQCVDATRVLKVVNNTPRIIDGNDMAVVFRAGLHEFRHSGR